MAFSVEEAAARILADVTPTAEGPVPLREALGRVLARDVAAPIDHPPWNNSSMDGYAVRAADVAGAALDAPARLEVIATVRAGQRASLPVRPGTAIRIMTGAPIPDGADSVIRVEDTDAGETTVVVRDARDAGRNLRPRGEDLRAGAVALAAGTAIGPAQLGVLATIGCASVPVHRRPRVAVLTSGDELVDVSSFAAVRAGDRIVSSNTYTLMSAAAALGADVVDLGIAPDDPDALAAHVTGARGYDLLITSGGVSVGAFDFTRDVLQRLGATLDLWRVRMRPGAPLGFGRLDGMPWLGLPGNPVSALVTFELFARPLIKRLRGERRVHRVPISVRLAEPVSLGAPLTHFLRATVHREGGELIARLTGPQGSGLLTSLARADALVIVRPEQQRLEAGALLPALLLGDSALSSDTFSLA